MSLAGNVKVPDSLLAEVERAAHAENRSADEVVKAAIERYLEERGWQRTFSKIMIVGRTLRASARTT